MNVFLTGEKNIGKSTIINRVLAFANPSYAGFRSTITTDVHNPQASCHMMPLYCVKSMRPIQPTPSIDNELFLCTPSGKMAPEHIKLYEPAENQSIITERFNTLGCNIIDEAIRNIDNVDLIVMDELGPAEAYASDFIAKITQCMESDTPVLGVLQKCDAEYINELKMRTDTSIFEVTKDNRDNLHIAVMSVLKLWSYII